MKRVIGAWALYVLSSVFVGCGSSNTSPDLGNADGDVQFDSGLQDMGDTSLCGGEICGANTVCVGSGSAASCECAPTALGCGDACAAGTVEQTPYPNPVASWVEDPARGCVGQPVVIQRAGQLTAVRVVMPPSVAFTVDVGVLPPAYADLGLTGQMPNSLTCVSPSWYWTTWASGQGVGQGAACNADPPCPASTAAHYTTVDLTGDLEVEVGDVLYFMFRFDTEAFAYPMAFQTHYLSDETEYIRIAQNIEPGGHLAFETLVAECD